MKYLIGGFLMKYAKRIVWTVLSIMGVLLSGLVQAQGNDNGARGRNNRLYAVPVPGPLTIDGKLDDWDLSGQILIFVTQETSETVSARVAMMYDAQALYISGVMRDPSPMMNKHDPRVEADRAWDADAFQLRLVLDAKQPYPLDQSSFTPVPNDQMVHMLLWYYTDRQEPCLHLAYGMNLAPPKAGYPGGAVPAEKFQGAYVMAPDKKGCTFEYRIPWSTLEAKIPPKAGDHVASAIQIQWGAPDGLSSGGGGWAMDLMATTGFSFQSSYCWGKAIFTARGNLPKAVTQVDGGPRAQAAVKPQPLSFSYSLPKDGDVSIALMDGEGQIVRHIVTQGPRQAGAITEQWDGLDENGKLLPAGNYSWKGIYHDPISTRYLLSVHNSGQPTFATDDGTGAWGADHGRPSTVCAAGERMLLAWDGGEAGWSLLRASLQGRKEWGIKQGALHLATDGERIYASGGGGFFEGSGVQCFALSDGRPLNFDRGTPKAEEPGPAGVVERPAGAAAYGADGKLVTAAPDRGANTVTGLAYHHGILYVAYANRDMIALYNARKGTIASTWSVPTPRRLAVTAQGEVAVISGNGVVMLADGKETRRITTHLDSPVSIAADAKGNLYVANLGALQNVSVFDNSGKYLHAIGERGGRPRVGRFDKHGMLEPGGISIDHDGNLWVAETLDCPKRISVWNTASGKCMNEFFGAGHYSTSVSMDPAREDEVYCHNVAWTVDLEKGTWYPKSTMWRATEPNQVDSPSYGHHVITARNGKQYAWVGQAVVSPMSALYQRNGDTFYPILSCFTVGAKGESPYPSLNNTGLAPGAYIWQDTNGDHRVQPSEVSGPTPFSRFIWVDTNLGIWSEADSGLLLRPDRFTVSGQPVYDVAKVTRTGIAGSHEFGGLYTDPAGDRIYTITPDIWPMYAAWSPERKMLWTYPTPSWRAILNKPIAKPGQAWGVSAGLGVAGDFTGIATYFGPFNLFTTDGIYVAQLFKDGRLGETGPDVINAESFSGQLIQMEKSRRYLLLAGDTDGRVTEVLGLDTVKRLSGGAYTITPDDLRKVQEELAAYAGQQASTQPLCVVRGKDTLRVAQSVSRIVDDKRGFSAKVAYDETNLYLDMTVTGPNELTNSIPDPRILFKGGNCIDLQLATDSAADDKRATPAVGDLRVLLTRHEGKPYAVIYRPKVKEFTGQPQVLTSPTGKESFDRIDAVQECALVYEKTATGFRAQVTLPLALLEWAPQPASTVKIDVGYLFGNATGNQCGQRAYWANTSPTSGIIGDIPNESRLEPKEWGEATVE